VEGNKNVSSLVIFGHLQEKEGELLSLRRVRDDIHNLFAMGDFKDVQADAAPVSAANQVVLTFKVVERPLIDKIAFSGNKKWDNKKFLEEMKLAPKTAYDPAKVDVDLRTIKKLYQDEGYSSVLVTSRTVFNVQANTADLSIEIFEGNQVKVASVVIVGAQAFSDKRVKEELKENKEGDKFKPETLEEDLRKIEEFYHNEGFLKAAVVDHKEQLNDEKKKVTITVTVREGQKYVLGNTRFHGNLIFADDELLKMMKLKKGEPLKKNDLDEGVRAIRSSYAEKGYISGGVNPRMDYDDDLKTADLTVEIVEGSVSYIQDIKIIGNYKTKDYVIRRELLVKPGDKLELSAIKVSSQRLFNLGFFDEVNPDFEPGDEPGKEILVFRIKERHTGTISLGGGYSSLDGFVGTLKLEDANLFGKGQRANLDLQFGASNTSFNVGFTEPWLFNTPTQLSVNVFDTKRTFNGSINDPTSGRRLYDEIQLGGSFSLGRRLDRFWTISGAYSLQKVQISNIGLPYSTPGSGQFIPASDTTTSSFTPRILYDTRDNVFDPTRGWKNQISIQIAGGPLQFDNNFVKLIADSSHYISLPLNFTLGEHVRLGVAQGYAFLGKGFTDVPVYERFYAGGADTIRGYGERSIGPPLGGRALFVFNTEFKHDIAGPLKGVLFFDAGSCWQDYLSLNNAYPIEYGAGFGIRLTIPGTVMAIRLDYGWPIATELNDTQAPKGGSLHFNLGDIF
jgi:outer membrane protein insertion porin family